jgi:hypothetical protein
LKTFFKKLYRGWIAFGEAMGTVMSYIIMTILYFLVIGPIAILLRLFRVDVLGLRKPKTSNWHPIEKFEDGIRAYRRLS